MYIKKRCVANNNIKCNVRPDKLKEFTRMNQVRCTFYYLQPLQL